MTDIIKHECGIAVIRLLKPLNYYYNKYGTWQYGLDKMYLLMEKQHNRGQEGAGLGAVKLNLFSGKGHWGRVPYRKYFPIYIRHSSDFPKINSVT